MFSVSVVGKMVNEFKFTNESKNGIFVVHANIVIPNVANGGKKPEKFRIFRFLSKQDKEKTEKLYAASIKEFKSGKDIYLFVQGKLVHSNYTEEHEIEFYRYESLDYYLNFNKTPQEPKKKEFIKEIQTKLDDFKPDKFTKETQTKFDDLDFKPGDFIDDAREEADRF